MNKIFIGLIPLLITAPSYSVEISNSEKLWFETGFAAAQSCKVYGELTGSLFLLKKNNEEREYIAKFTNALGEDVVNDILAFKGDEKKYSKKIYATCIDDSKKEFKVQKPKIPKFN